jgi:ribosomal protein S18 acetylase RimI-like enzyme
MLKKVTGLKDEKILYEYFKKISPEMPNYFLVDFAKWRESMFNENDDGVPWFYELETYLLYEESILKGFIQYGLTSHIFTDDGNDYNNHYALIRNMHYAKDSKNPNELMETALNYFNEKDINEITAYFHIFGMRCYGTHGKLHWSQFYIEDLLHKFYFSANEQNIYLSKELNNYDINNDSEIECRVETKKHIHVTFFLKNEEIGSCSLEAVQDKLYWMWWFGIHEKFQRQGLGKRCLNNLFYILKEKNIEKVDLDTYPDNFAALILYDRAGFVNKGCTRSYKKEPMIINQ